MTTAWYIIGGIAALLAVMGTVAAFRRASHRVAFDCGLLDDKYPRRHLRVVE